MATNQILSIGTGDATSSDITVAIGDVLTVCLNDVVGDTIHNDARVDIQLKDGNDAYFTIEKLTGLHAACVIAGAGTYRFRRYPGKSCGVFSDDGE